MGRPPIHRLLRNLELPRHLRGCQVVSPLGVMTRHSRPAVWDRAPQSRLRVSLEYRVVNHPCRHILPALGLCAPREPRLRVQSQFPCQPEEEPATRDGTSRRITRKGFKGHPRRRANRTRQIAAKRSGALRSAAMASAYLPSEASWRSARHRTSGGPRPAAFSPTVPPFRPPSQGMRAVVAPLRGRVAQRTPPVASRSLKSGETDAGATAFARGQGLHGAF